MLKDKYIPRLVNATKISHSKCSTSTVAMEDKSLLVWVDIEQDKYQVANQGKHLAVELGKQLVDQNNTELDSLLSHL